MSKRAALSRFRVCDFTTGEQGPAATRWLTLFGAEVIKVEDRSKPDPARLLEPFAHGRAGAEQSAVFNNLNVGKRGVAIELGGRRGRRLAVELAAQCDLVCFDPPGPETIDLDLDLLDRSRPARAPALIVAVGPPAPADRDDPTAADATAWARFALTILCALWHRDETGEGSEVICFDHLNGESGDGHRVSSQTTRADAVRRTVACDDGWVAVESRHGADRAALTAVTGPTDGDLDRWCRRRSRWQVEAELQQAGVPVAVVRCPGERVDGDIATGARRMWPMVDHPVMGGVRVEGAAVELSRTTWTITTPAPLLGQDTRWALTTILDRSDDELERLAALRVIDP